ncbi:MAG: inositol monophosphatase [Actinomyces urogenitalis]|uniref:inositol monophosphatase family protein n=1 Tax=Actinomyces urogenitalis TaxID=103621 RepID=UPI0029150E3A|nr:inositol monophosphatase [Actinomyces urogenitalis]MDU6152218.1 inositol monophosphatase [Actinomyces urogenitalis]
MDELLAQGLEAVRAGARLALDPGESLRIDTKRNRNDVVTQVDRGVEALIAEMLAPTGYAFVGEEAHAAGSWAGRVWVLDPIDGTLNYVAVHRGWAISLALVEDGRPVLGIVADPVDDRLYVALAGSGAWEGRLGLREGDACCCPPETAASVGSDDGASHMSGESAVPGASGDGAVSHGAEPASVVAHLVPGARPMVVEDSELADGVVIAHLHAMAALRHLPEIIESSRGLRVYGAAALELAEVAAGRAGCLVHTRLQTWDVAAGVLLCQEAGAVVTRMDGASLDVREAGSVLAGPASAHATMARRLIEG